jgi:AraC-like DNA-binding protein
MAKEEYFAEKEAFIEKRNELSGKYREIEDVIAKANKTICDCEYDLEIFNTTLEDLRKDYEKEFKKQFEGNTECPVCHRPLPEEMVNEAKAQFEQYKATNIANIKEAAERVNKNIDSRTQEMNDARETINRVTPSLEMLKGQLVELEKEPVLEPIYDNLPDVVALQGRINHIKQMANDKPNKELESLNEALTNLRKELSEIEGTYKVLENNKAIDSKVAELREKKIADEQHRAEAEKMLYQIEQFERRKNEMLEGDINQHFGLVEWKLFDFQKNGSYQECCIPTYQGKNINTQTNEALSIMLKIDIAVSLQKFYGLYVPVVVDEAERLDRSSRNDIKCDSQLIYLTVSDDQEIVGC